ncbi:DUF2314 domain-containing protein [Octadecabacter sp. G9-8]|uniref:DUF2314 domain-containing protein n=1 Tax=Octadecabacter dasysiphoniae TaxID=2909341 RepID=A0ABS9CVH2_9RHOB|nr:DUF2314 domain-containing protein [Octadecabacter dasysiphoniae]MCF2870181.1 DUF2314 domain-containing protein [Octadecabacter dasysiphoniae]
MKKLMIGVVILAGLWFYNNGTDPVSSDAANGDPVEAFASDDAQMNAAMDAALTTLPAFLENQTDDAGNAIGQTSVKVAFEIGTDAFEIIWVSGFNWDGGVNMAGFLANQPNYMGDLNAGDRVEFTTDMVRDWSLTEPDGTMWGNYTTRVIVPQLDADTAAALNAMLSPDPVPSDWN